MEKEVVKVQNKKAIVGALLKRILRFFRNRVSLLLLAIVSLVITAFIVLNAFEQVFFYDIPFLETLRKYNHSQEITEVQKKIPQNEEFLHQAVRDIPRYLVIPSINSNIELTESLLKEGSFYVRGNKAHVIKTKKSNTMIIYLDENWRTTTDLSNLKNDELLFVMSYDFNYLYKIEEVLVNSTDLQFIKNIDDPRPQVIVVGELNNSYVVVTATLLNSVYR